MQLFSLGGLGIWFLLDLILILVGEFKDAEMKQESEILKKATLQPRSSAASENMF